MTTRPAGARARLAKLSGVAVVLLCVVLAAPVWAYVSSSKRSVTVPEHGHRAVTAVCPRGQNVTFGGVIAQFDVAHDAIAYPTGMRKTAAGKWSVYGSSLSTTRGSRLTAVAYCANVKPVITATKTVKVPEGRSGAATATCPAGTVVVGGGFNTRAFPHFEDVKGMERRTARTWRVTILNITGGGTSLTAIAYCGHGAVPVLRAHAIRIASGSGGTVRARCPAGMQLLFGGQVSAAPGVALRLPHVFPFSFRAESKTRWAVAAGNGGGAAGTLTALAYCR
jgi:hypothetical protein